MKNELEIYNVVSNLLSGESRTIICDGEKIEVRVAKIDPVRIAGHRTSCVNQN